MTTKEKEVLSALSKEQAAFETQREELEREHQGEWVVFHDGELAGIYADLQEAANDALHKFGLGPYLIEQVGTPSPQVRSFLLYTPDDSDESSPKFRP